MTDAPTPPTAGPWFAHLNSAGYYDITAGGEYSPGIGQCHSHKFLKTGTHHGNARVMAASWEMMNALDGMVLVCGRTGDAFHDFEEQAAAFQAETGWMRPGKDSPMHYGDDRDDFEARRLKYSAWVQTKIEAGRAALAKAVGSAA